METLDRGRAPLPESADDPLVHELLARWDELPGTGLRNLESHPVHGPSLRLLQRAEAFLHRAPAEACPEPSELYDFGRGPGYAPLPATRRQAIADHMSRCEECEDVVLTLESGPPTPLQSEGAPAPWSAPNGPRPLAPQPVDRRGRWIPMVAAAAVVVVGFGLLRNRDSVQAGWPAAPVLRGGESGSLLFPRDKILEARSRTGFADDPLFEIAALPRAESYRIRVLRHSGGAFEDGSLVFELADESPVLQAGRSLPPGHYTWEAWAVIDGLDQVLGERDFQIVADPELVEQVGALMDPIQRVRVLHDAGYWNDARHLARSLPTSPDRDAYLASPGR